MISGPSEEEETKILDNFFFLVFMSNPRDHKVKVLVDGGVLKTTMKEERFKLTLARLCSPDLVRTVERALLEYGSWFLIDRSKNSLRELSPTEEPEKLQIKTIHEDVLAEIRTNKDYKDAAISEYEDTIMQKLSLEIHKDPGVHVSKGAGHINYSLRRYSR